MMDLTRPQFEMLQKLAERRRRGLPSEWFAPSSPVRRALQLRGLVRCQFIGMRWWRIEITRAGLDALATAEIVRRNQK